VHGCTVGEASQLYRLFTDADTTPTAAGGRVQLNKIEFSRAMTGTKPTALVWLCVRPPPITPCPAAKAAVAAAGGWWLVAGCGGGWWVAGGVWRGAGRAAAAATALAAVRFCIHLHIYARTHAHTNQPYSAVEVRSQGGTPPLH
jgi:hypothetical protein